MSKQIGNHAEDLALAYLSNIGLHCLQRNFYSRFGEIDLIMQDSDTLVFVEVRKRSSGKDYACESITISKQRKLVKTAEYYLMKLGREVNCRFDAILIDANNSIEWLKNIIIL
ncbi:MAG: YraN family protein [Neisseriaceae bacterium]|nr:MAG: YraN family protein [Neisseriaceae bacterium]